MAQMQNAAPARKVVASALAAAIAAVFIWALNQYVLNDPVPVEIAGAVTTIVTFLTGYYLPPSPRDQTVDGTTPLGHATTPGVAL